MNYLDHFTTAEQVMAVAGGVAGTARVLVEYAIDDAEETYAQAEALVELSHLLGQQPDYFSLALKAAALDTLAELRELRDSLSSTEVAA